jgi:hypothetical protein
MKTLNLINKYFKIIEQSNQPLDATEPNLQQSQEEAPVSEQPKEEYKGIASAGEQYLIVLAIKAFAHTPYSQELKWLDKIQSTYRNTNPKKIASHIALRVGLSQREFSKLYVSPKPDQEVNPLSEEGEKMLIDIIMRSFEHTPDDNELSIIDTVRREYFKTAPEEVTSTIQKLLDGGKEELINTINQSY